MNQAEARDLVVQTGADGEHQGTTVEIGGDVTEVDQQFFNLRLAAENT